MITILLFERPEEFFSLGILLLQDSSRSILIKILGKEREGPVCYSGIQAGHYYRWGVVIYLTLLFPWQSLGWIGLAFGMPAGSYYRIISLLRVIRPLTFPGLGRLSISCLHIPWSMILLYCCEAASPLWSNMCIERLTR